MLKFIDKADNPSILQMIPKRISNMNIPLWVHGLIRADAEKEDKKVINSESKEKS